MSKSLQQLRVKMSIISKTFACLYLKAENKYTEQVPETVITAHYYILNTELSI